MKSPTGIAVTHAQHDAPQADIRVGLIGHGIQLSRTPRMHMEEGAAKGLDYCYDLIDVATMDEVPDIGDLVAQVEEAGYAGVNVTHPFKQAVVAHLDSLSDAATAVNAVNTIVFRDGKRFGHNTDYWGFGEAFRQGMSDVPRDRVLLVGAGGAGGAVANALVDCGIGHLVLHDTHADTARRLAESINARVGDGRVSVASDLEAEIALANGLVNATPVGMATHPGSPIEAGALRPDHWVADIIYFPLETELLRAARGLGCRVLDGSGMAVFQAVRAFELFTGAKPDPTRMRATFDAFVPESAGLSGT